VLTTGTRGPHLSSHQRVWRFGDSVARRVIKRYESLLTTRSIGHQSLTRPLLCGAASSLAQTAEGALVMHNGTFSWNDLRRSTRHAAPRCLATVAGLLLSTHVVLAQSPWERAASNLEISFTGPLARSLALVAIVIGGLMFMFGEGGAKRQISGIVFGGGLALFAVQFLTWLF
jgi:type IV secretory pathway VirB2 component (pilin)